MALFALMPLVLLIIVPCHTYSLTTKYKYLTKMIQFGNLLKVWSTLKYCIRYRTDKVTFSHFLRDFPETQCSVLYNGLTVATEERATPNACIGLYINGGSRYENETNNGVAHFFEHIAFKGTNKRPKNILDGVISSTGAKFKCFTTREIVVYYVECLSEDVPCVADILFDCIFNNSFSNTDIAIQKNIVYQEMINHDKSTVGVLYDYLHSTAFQGTSLAQTVMGTSNNLYNFKSADIANFVTKMLIPQRMVLAAVGGVNHDMMLNLGQKYFYPVNSDVYDLGPKRYTGSEIVYRDDSIPIAHVAIAVEGPAFSDEDKLPMDLASTIIGAWDTSQPGGIDHGTPLAYYASAGGLCDFYKAFNYYYQDTGLCGVEFISPKLEVDDMMMTIQEELMKLCHSLTDGELIKAKNELKSKILTQLVNTSGACHDIGEYILRTGCRPTISERMKAIDDLSADRIKTVCDKYFYDKCPVVAGIGSTECLMPYARTRTYMYWLRV